ncbi:hypothetical protein HNP55_004660 [Paucibacter oligotrophus]|uniref:Uncharacterized protein n=1 Tax=Roseateles oligotrophus TaxID=1769250 RepID=A0A840LD61_9BURK|nr:hypothetical protein [Roseateles oligotrophus]
MPRYKPSDCHALMLPVVLSEQIVPGSLYPPGQVILIRRRCRRSLVSA